MRELMPFRGLIDNFRFTLIGQLTLIVYDRSCNLEGVVGGFGIFRVDREVVALHQLRVDFPNPKAFQQRDQFEVYSDGRSKDNCFQGRTDRVLDLVRPDVIHRLVGLEQALRNNSLEDQYLPSHEKAPKHLKTKSG